MKRFVIIGGASISNYDFIKKNLSLENDFYVFCDSGLKHKEKLGIKPDLIIGDFDSFKGKIDDSENIIKLPCEKDDTDSVYAIKLGVKNNYDDFLLIGLVGNRFDHSFANIGALIYLAKKKKNAILLDDYSKMLIVQKQKIIVDKNCKYFSLLNVNGLAKGINIENAKYQLKNGKITSDYQYGVSNEVLENQITRVQVKKGMLLLVEVFFE